MNLAEITAAVANLARPNGAFYGFTTVTSPKLTKKSRATGEPTNFTVQIVSTFSAMLGVSYENAVNNAKERAGEERDFTAQKPFGKHYVGDSKWLMQSDKDESKYYIAVDKVGGVSRKYLINGKEATEEQIADLKANYLPKPSANPYGVTWRTYGIEGVKAVR